MSMISIQLKGQDKIPSSEFSVLGIELAVPQEDPQLWQWRIQCFTSAKQKVTLSTNYFSFPIPWSLTIEYNILRTYNWQQSEFHLTDKVTHLLGKTYSQFGLK